MERANREGVVIRSLSRHDYNKPELFQAYINGLISDVDAMVSFATKKTIEEEKAWLKNAISLVESSKAAIFIAETEDLIVGEAAIGLCSDRRKHVAELGISVIKDYRKRGIGTCLMQKILSCAGEKLVPAPKAARLSVFGANSIAIAFYERYGFRVVASIPGQFEFKGELIDEVIMLKELRRR